MSRTWAVARHMIAEGIRMKIALVFLGLIGMVVLALPFSIEGDSSLTGAVQSFMSYSLSATAVLLGALTILLSRSLADELVNRQILLVMTKPIPRWQYIVGKWLGITVLNATLLACSGLTIFGMVHYIRWTHPPIDKPDDGSKSYDEVELENEVLVARHALKCKLPDFTGRAELELQRNLEQGRYDNVPEFDAAKLKAQLTRKHEAKWRVVGPLDFRVFEFENVLCDRSPGKQVQIRYKTDVSGHPPDEIFRAMWRVGNPVKGTRVYDIPIRQAVGRHHTVRVPADAVARDRTLTALFINENPDKSEPQYRNVMEFRKSNEVEVLFIVGSFEGNFVRLLVLMMCKLMFLAAVAILMTTVFSFPVACLASFTVYVLAGLRSFILEALDFSSDNYATMFTSVKDFILQCIGHVYHMGHWIIPDFTRYDAVEPFVNGRNVGLVWVLQGLVDLVALKTLIVLGLAILLFHRREVAEVSV